MADQQIYWRAPLLNEHAAENLKEFCKFDDYQINNFLSKANDNKTYH